MTADQRLEDALRETLREMPAIDSICARHDNQHRADVLFIDTDLIDSVAGDISPETYAIAVGSDRDPETITAVLDSGMNEFLAFPFDRTCLWHALIRARGRTSRTRKWSPLMSVSYERH